jgi:hypothetical protein
MLRQGKVHGVSAAAQQRNSIACIAALQQASSAAGQQCSRRPAVQQASSAASQQCSRPAVQQASSAAVQRNMRAQS